MAATRTAEAHWEGSLKEGEGEVKLVSSGIGTYPVSWPARTEQPNGMTSPEELIAAAHSTCFSMSVANELVLA
ncbi:MAG TPA: peroxiredoxin, partial [Propionibacteriaceae bacterium]|nr:peroxiredoxin [Propionibacteriaceae bacterium]